MTCSRCPMASSTRTLVGQRRTLQVVDRHAAVVALDDFPNRVFEFPISLWFGLHRLSQSARYAELGSVGQDLCLAQRVGEIKRTSAAPSRSAPSGGASEIADSRSDDASEPYGDSQPPENQGAHQLLSVLLQRSIEHRRRRFQSEFTAQPAASQAHLVPHERCASLRSTLLIRQAPQQPSTLQL